MRILITGANGFVGRHLTLALAARNIPLCVVARKDDFSWLPNGDIKKIIINNFDGETDWQDALKGVSHVINLAGRAHIFNETFKDPEQAFMDVNCHGAVRLYQAASEAGVKGFLQISSIGVLGTSTKYGQPFNDDTIPAPSSDYAKSKYAGEQGLLELANISKTPLIILRPPLIVGAGAKGNLQRLMKIVKKPIPLPLLGINNRRTLLSIENLISAIKVVLLHWQTRLKSPKPGSVKSLSGTFVISDKKSISTSEIIKTIHEGVKGRALLFPVPSIMLALTLRLAGGSKLCEQLMGDLEVNGNNFQSTFNWIPVVDTKSCLCNLRLK